MLPTCNLPTPQVLELPAHVVDGLVELVNFVVQFAVPQGPMAIANCRDLGQLLGVGAFLESAEAESPLLARVQPSALGLRKQPPGKTGGTEDGTGHGRQNQAAARSTLVVSSHRSSRI